MRGKLARAQLEREPHEGPVDYLQRVALARPQWASALGEMCSLYVDLRYGAAPPLRELRRLKSLVRQFSL